MNNFIEQQIIEAVKKLLCGRVNELIEELQSNVPIVEFGNYRGKTVISPTVYLSACEQTEKERIIQLDVYTVSIFFLFDESPESEYYCYAYSKAVEKALKENATLGGVADRAVISGKRYIQPKNKGCGDNWELDIHLRLTVEGIKV
jgi:hypothetical protein